MKINLFLLFLFFFTSQHLEAQPKPGSDTISLSIKDAENSNDRSPTDLRTLQDCVIDRNLRTVSGVADIVAFGGPIKAYDVNVNPDLLAQYDISALDVFDAISKSNVNVGGDVIEKSARAFVVRGLGLGSETQKPLAIVIVGGLISATLLTLLIFPVTVHKMYREKKPELINS